MLELRDVHLQVRGVPLLSGISLSVQPGELVVVLGPNGAGKSTLLRVLSGDLLPTAGRVVVAGKPLADWERLALARRRAVLTQGARLDFGFTVFEVALLGRSPHIRAAETLRDREIARLALRETGTEHLAERSYPTLSGGERQRVQLARALAQIWEALPVGERALLLDEPTAALDPVHQHGTLQAARRFAVAGTAVLAVLHDLNLAAQYADRLLVMESGRLVAEGTPQQVLNSALLRTVYGLDALVIPHPRLDCPLVVPLGVVHGQG